MSDAPERIWVGSDICHDNFGPEPNIWKDEASSYETDIQYTRSDLAQHLTVLPQEQFDRFLAACGDTSNSPYNLAQARVAKLEAALKYISDHAGQTGFKQTATHENATLICEFAFAALGETT
jgi:hypothetical protein